MQSNNKKQTNKDNNINADSEVVGVKVREYNSFLNTYESMKTRLIKTSAELNNEKKWNKIEIDDLLQERDVLKNGKQKLEEENSLLKKNITSQKSKIIRSDLIDTISIDEMIEQMTNQMDKEYESRYYLRKKAQK
jgi:hypothetical protein